LLLPLLHSAEAQNGIFEGKNRRFVLHGCGSVQQRIMTTLGGVDGFRIQVLL
jgi:hypothetical protein